MTQKISDMGVSTQPSSSPSWLLKNASLLHGESLTLLTGHDVLIASGRITRIAPSGGMASNEDTVKAVDASGYLILPGFVNACVSLKQMPSQARIPLILSTLQSGVTTMGLLTRGDEDNDDLEVFPQIQPVRQEAGYLYRTTDSVFLNFPDCPELPKSKRSIPTGIVTYTSTTSKGPFFASWSPTTRSANPWRYIQSTLMGASPATEFVAPGKEAEERLKQCILSLTRNSALALGLDHTGLIQEGFNADLLFLKVHQVESDILSDSVFDLLYNTSITENERNVIQAVMKRGTILHSATPALWSITPTFSDAYPTATLSDSDFTFDSIESAILSLKAGNFILVVDNEDRENEGDLIIAAEDLTEEKAAFMIRYTSGVLCVPAVEERLKDLELPLMVEQNKDSFKTAYTITVDHKDTTTGISAADRARTVRALSDPSEPASNFNRPGHVFPLRYTPGGVLKRIGHTEASVDLCKLAGKRPVAAISEVILDTGSMARRNDLIPFARKWGIKLVTIADLVAYRLKHGLVEL